LRGNDAPNLLFGRRGDDELSAFDDPPGIVQVDWLIGGRGDDTMDGGDGSDVVSFFPATGAVTVDLAVQTASGEGNDTFTSIENVEGSDFKDNLTGNGNDNVFVGRPGDDTIDGAAGSDVVAFLYTRRGVTVDLAAGAARGDGADTLTGIEGIWGSGYNDRLRGGAGPNFIRGLPGNDVIGGRRGNDRLLGGPQRDTVRGGAGTDACAGERERGCERNPEGTTRAAVTTGSALPDKWFAARGLE
jgi:Ca2+-binding RTX toxin-like protein